jgi:hypothetical protein
VHGAGLATDTRAAPEGVARASKAELVLDGLPDLLEGTLRRDPDRRGHGLELREADAERYAL